MENSDLRNKERLGILQHSLGLDEYGQGDRFRNHFVTGPGNSDFDICKSLVSDGLMVEQTDNKLLTKGDSVFFVTDKGINYVADNSPKPPEPPKMTRGQKRYRDYLNSESGQSFAEWLGIGR